MSDIISNENKLEYLKRCITTYPDFPKKNVLFRDIFGALLNGRCCEYLKELLVAHIRNVSPGVELIVGLESRGFLFNLMLASDLGVGCAPIRKKGKLPGDCLSIEYTLEYGSDVFEIQSNAIKAGQNVIIIDDLLASGGSLDAAVKLVRKAGGNVLECLVVIELLDLNGRQRLDTKVHSLIQY